MRYIVKDQDVSLLNTWFPSPSTIKMLHNDGSFDILTSKDIEWEDVCEIFIFNEKYRLGSISNITNKILDTNDTDIGRDFDEDELADLYNQILG